MAIEPTARWIGGPPRAVFFRRIASPTWHVRAPRTKLRAKPSAKFRTAPVADPGVEPRLSMLSRRHTTIQYQRLKKWAAPRPIFPEPSPTITAHAGIVLPV